MLQVCTASIIVTKACHIVMQKDSPWHKSKTAAATCICMSCGSCTQGLCMCNSSLAQADNAVSGSWNAHQIPDCNTHKWCALDICNHLSKQLCQNLSQQATAGAKQSRKSEASSFASASAGKVMQACSHSMLSSHNMCKQEQTLFLVLRDNMHYTNKARAVESARSP